MNADPRIASSRALIEQALREKDRVDLSWIHPLPANNDWTLAPDAIRFLFRLVELVKPRHVIELGAGLSTRTLLRACASLEGGCSITSLDHDPEFGVPAPWQLECPASIELKCSLAPVVARNFGGKLLPAYLFDASQMASVAAADLIIIDGPPVTLGGREGTLYQLLEFTRPGTIILLDDASRATERAAVQHWKDNLQDAIEVTYPHGFAKGLAALIVREPVSSSALWERKLAITRQEIEAAVPAGASFILLDQNYWAEPFAGDRRDLALVEREGVSWGLPADDSAALQELQSQQQGGATHLALLWPAFWWLDCYPGLFQHLRATCEVILQNDRVLLFQLR